MRKLSYAVFVFAAILILAFVYCEGSAPKFLPVSNTAYANIEAFHMDKDVLRLHVVANSDSEKDQRVKLIVRDALLKQFAPTASLQQAEEVLLENGANVLETVESVLRDQGCAYGAQLRFGIMEFPDKTYAGVSYPAGKYEALKVELGEASGQNWWCVLFPPLCLTDIAIQDLPDTDELIFESDLLKFLYGKK